MSRQPIAEVKRSSPDEQISERDHDPLYSRLRVDPRGDLTDLAGKRFGGNSGNNGTEIAAPSSSLLRRRAR